MKQQERFFRRRMREIVSAIRAVGLDPYSQLAGYIRTGDDAYITQYENARIKIRFLDGMMYFNFYRSIFARKNWMRLLSQRAIQIKAQCNCGSASPPIYPAQSGLDRHSASSSCTVRTNSSISREHHFSLWEKICRYSVT